MNVKMTWGYDLQALQEYNISIPIELEVSSHCHSLITGSSGSGKSMALLFLLGKILQAVPNTRIYLCDFKNSDDFHFLAKYPFYFAGKNVVNGIVQFYEMFNAVREGDSVVNERCILICDEYPALISYLQMNDKLNKTKDASIVLNSIMELLMLGRGIGSGFGVWIVCQRASATLFPDGARDNFMISIGLGRLSKESKGILFPGQEIDSDKIYRPGEGLLWADGRSLMEVKYPLPGSVSDWKKHILTILMRTGGACTAGEHEGCQGALAG